MAAFAWTGRNPRGEALNGEVEAESAHAAATRLEATGVTLLSITERISAAQASPWARWSGLGSSPVSSQDLLIFSRQMYALQRAGVPILRALASLQASTAKDSLIKLLIDLRASLEQGHELATAMKRHSNVFNGFYVAMIRVGEMSGRLTEVFERLARHIEFELDVRARIAQALRYPTMVMVAIVIAMAVINLFVIPTFAQVFAQFKAELPPMTKLLMAVSRFSVDTWPLILAAGVGDRKSVV